MITLFNFTLSKSARGFSRFSSSRFPKMGMGRGPGGKFLALLVGKRTRTSRAATAKSRTTDANMMKF